jgi:predicted ATPase/DNA-binding winged helix-turn-helix (wHTH) protein
MSEPLAYRFGPWRLLPGQRLLAIDGAPVKLGGRAFDMLVALVEQRHRVLGKHELMDLVWPRLVVEENNLQVQMVALRKLLGHPAIATVPGRGYRFTLPVEVSGAEAPAAAAPAAPPAAPALPQAGNLPTPLPRLIGRNDDLRTLLALLREHPLVTVTGAAGIGKTRLAESAAASAAAATGLAAWWVELAPVGDAGLVPLAAAQALSATPGAGRDAVESIAAAIGTTPTLLVLDNAEHLLEGVIQFQQALAARAPAVRWLVTSQETLRLPTEQVLRLNPLALPEARGAPAPDGGAAELFLARVQAADPRFALRGEQAASVADICRQLDGIPLALELAAARVPLLGLEGVRSRLADRFKLLSAGSRAVLRRHQTLHAALAWSHALLSEPEQRVFRRLGVFVGGFTLEAAQAVADDDTIDAWDVIEHVGTLADKSLVITGSAAVDPLAAPRCHLLETTRLFALEQLAQAGETEATLLRHAQAMRALVGINTPLARAWFAQGQRRGEAAAEVANVRAACDWAARGGGDAATAIQLHSPLYVAFSAGGLLREAVQRLRGLAARIDPALPAAQVAHFWRVAAAASGGRADPFCLHAALQACTLCRELGDTRALFESLSLAIGLRARMGELEGLAELIEEGRAIERPEYSPNLRSNFHWALHRYRLAQGRAADALASALLQAQVVAGRGDGFEHVLFGGNAAWCELAMGDAAAAAARASAAVQALRERGNTGNHLGYPLQVLAEALLALGRYDEGLAAAREAQPRLAADSDDSPLLEPLALAAAQRGRHEAAARVAGHVDTAYAASGQRRWPYEASRRVAIETQGVAALGKACWQQQLTLGARLSRDEAVALALGDAAPQPPLSPPAATGAARPA